MWISNYQSFWDSFWAGLFSGTIYSLIVGVIVGKIIWNFQSNAEKREVERECERDFSVFLQNLSVGISLENNTVLGYSFSSSIPENLIKSLDLIKVNPIPYWAHNMSDTNRYRKIINSIDEIRKKYNEFSLLANKLDSNLQQLMKPRFSNSPNLRVI